MSALTVESVYRLHDVQVTLAIYTRHQALLPLTVGHFCTVLIVIAESIQVTSILAVSIS